MRSYFLLIIDQQPDLIMLRAAARPERTPWLAVIEAGAEARSFSLARQTTSHAKYASIVIKGIPQTISDNATAATTISSIPLMGLVNSLNLAIPKRFALHVQLIVTVVASK